MSSESRNWGSFNLLDEPWIVVLAEDGRERAVSILELFERAPRLSVIGGEVATQAFAITRLLLAFLHRALDGPANQDEWAQLWRQPELPMTRIAGYAARVRNRFDLFDARAPFFQVPELRTKKGEMSGLEKIVADVPNGEPFFTTRSAASLARIAPAEAARWLVHAHAFDPSGIKSGAAGDRTVKNGKGYPIGTGWAGQLGGVLVQGTNLRETLLLNLITRDVRTYVRIGGERDVPPWERDPDTAAREDDRPPAGAIQLYTWQTRRIRLSGDARGVTGVVLSNGDRVTPQNRQGLEPHTAWRYSEPQSKREKETVHMPLRHEPTRSVWRGLAAMLPSISPRRGSSGKPPARLAPGVLQWLCDLVQNELLPESFVIRLTVYGAEYGAQNATFAEIVEDVLPMSVVLLREDNPEAGKTAEGAVADTEGAARRLWRFAENLAQAAGAEPKSGAGDHARELLYAAVEQPFRDWLAGLGPRTDLAQERQAWQRAVRAACGPIAAELIAQAPSAAWTGREINQRTITVPLAELWFTKALRKELPAAYIRTEETV